MIAIARIWIFVALAISGLGRQAVSQDVPLELSLDSSVPSVPPFIEDSVLDNGAIQEKTLTTTRPQIVRAPLEMPSVQRSIVELPGDRLPSLTTPSDKQPLRATLTANRTKIADGDSVTELIVERYATGKPRLERWITEDADGNLVNHGSYTEWDEKGNVLSTGNFVYGERDGFWSKTISAAEAEALAGQLVGFTAPFQSEATFQRGQIDGSWRVLDARGRTVLEWSFRKGKRDGRSQVFSSSGEPSQVILYLQNRAVEVQLIAALEKSDQVRMIDGVAVRQVDEWYPAKSGHKPALKSQHFVLAATPLNVVATDWSANRVEYEKPSAQALAGVRHGPAVTFYANGQRESEGNYDHDRRTGTFAWWYSNGQQKTVGEFRDDVEHSSWTWWHENGMRQAAGAYDNGAKTDEWSWWNAEGKLVSRSTPDQTRMADANSGGEATSNR